MTRKLNFSPRGPRGAGFIRHDARTSQLEAVQSVWLHGHHRAGDRKRLLRDFFRNQPFTTEDLPAIEQKMLNY
jgi:hypothetical protein